MSPLPLICHPATPCPFIRHAAVSATRPANQQLILHFQMSGDIDALRLPAPSQPLRADGLWQHTCFEAFVRAARVPGYFELNFSPSGQWAAYRFEDYREGMRPLIGAPAPTVVCQRHIERLDICVEVNLAALDGCTGRTLQLALSAVIELHDGRLSYWALVHPDDRPDFHHPSSFTLTIPGNGEQQP